MNKELYISQYRLIEKIGEGGMGVIYLAEDTLLKRKAALKLLSPLLTTDKDANERFLKEARIVASFNHPNIVTIYEVNSFKGQYYFSLEFLEGENLRQKIYNSNKDKLSFEKIIEIFLQICSGLNKAHNAGIAHKDIKPENIFITNDFYVKILDFGLAGLFNNSGTTKEKIIMGSTAYMSPEQLQGGYVDHRTDIWSLGILFYETITGKLPFSGEYEQAITYSILNEEPEKIKTRVPGQLKIIIDRCLNKSRNSRFNSVEEIISELNSVSRNISSVTEEKSLLKPRSRQKISDYLSKTNLILDKPSEFFTGREEEQSRINQRIENIFRGQGYTIFIQGEPGVGKSQLIFKAAESALSRGATVLSGRCLFNEGGLPYHPFITGLKNAYSASGILDNTFIAALTASAEQNNIEISSALPFIKSFLGLSTESISLMNKEQLWNAILLLYHALSLEKPLLLIIDDLQWADKTTLGLLSFIARNSLNLPLLLAGIHRPHEYKGTAGTEPAPLLETTRQLKIEGIAEQINIERFDNRTAGSLLVKLLNAPVDEAVITNIYENSEGNPLFISELVKLLREEKYISFNGTSWMFDYQSGFSQRMILTGKVQDVIHQRIDMLDSNLREILEAASCEGEYFTTGSIIACLNKDKVSLLRSLNLLEKEHHLIKHEKNRYKFDHILIKEVFYRNILDELREEYHKTIALHLIREYGTNAEYAAGIARHLMESGDEKKAAGYLVTAAARAKELHALEDALKYYQRAFEILVKPEMPDNLLLLNSAEGLGDIFMLTGNTAAAMEKFNHYLELARKLENKKEESRALRKISEVYRIQGEINNAETLCNEAEKVADKNIDKKDLLECLNNRALILASKGDFNSSVDISKNALDLGRELNDLKSQSISLNNTGMAYWHMGNYPSAMEFLNHALKMQRSIGDNLGLSTTLNFLGMAYWKLGEYKNALESVNESIKLKKIYADSGKIPGGLNILGDIYRELYDINKAIQYHTESLSLAKEYQNKGAMCDNIRDLGEDYLVSGNYEEALRYFAEVLELSKNSGLLWYETRSYISLSQLHYLTGNQEKSLGFSNLGIEYSEKINAKDLIIEALWNQAKVKSSFESFDEIRKLFLTAIEIAGSVGHKTFLWKLYKDFSSFLSDNSKDFETGIYKNKSRQILREILANLDMELKKTFLNSPSVKEVLKFPENIEVKFEPGKL